MEVLAQSTEIQTANDIIEYLKDMARVHDTDTSNMYPVGNDTFRITIYKNIMSDGSIAIDYAIEAID